jgi:PKD repeat protein
MTNAGRIVFGVYPGSVRTVASTASYNDNQWHHVVATLGSAGMTLVVDGQVVGSRSDTTRGQSYGGYWRVGGDSLGGWTDQPTSSAFNGTIDDVAVYPTALSLSRVRAHYEGSGRSGTWTNVAPTASFTAATTGLTVNVDGSASTDPDGSIASYAWNFGDGTTGSGATTSKTYTAAGTYTVTLTVTDDRGATASTTRQVTVTAPANQAPTASFTTAVQGLTVSVDGSGSTDPDGTVASYAWNFGDGTTATGRTASRTYTAAGTYTVRLTVTDNGGATGTTTREVTVTAPAANVAPTASFTATTTGLTVNVDGRASSDTDGTIASYAWNFGDGTTGTGATTSKTYAAAGTYRVTLTVTDNGGATGSAFRDVVVTAPTNATLARDSFERSVTGGWGSADVGGAWTVSARSGTASVSDGAGRMTVGAGLTSTAYLNGVSSTSTDATTVITTAATAAGGPTIVCLIGRRVEGAGDYRVKLRQNVDGTSSAQLVRVVGTTETALQSTNLPAGQWVGGTRLSVRLQVFADGASTTVRSKVWVAGTTEPSTWTLTASDSTASLQAAGSTGVLVYTSSAATAASVLAFDDLVAVPVTGP